jgi:hypothetical protein
MSLLHLPHFAYASIPNNSECYIKSEEIRWSAANDGKKLTCFITDTAYLKI